MEVVILGAGVGGVTTALALAQRGYKVSLFERTPGPAHIGAGIVVWPNASFVLKELGVLPAVAALSGRPEKMRRVSAEGEDLGYLDIMALDQRMGFPSYSILRRDLQSVLLDELTRRGVEVHYNHRATWVETGDHGQVRVNFENGLQLTPDIVIGADGRMHSIARQFVNGNNTPIYQGFINWIGVCESDTTIVDDVCVTDTWGRGERFGVVPVTRSKVYWAGGIAQKNIDGVKPATNKAALLSIFRGWPDPIPGIIERTPEALINKIFVHDHDPIDTWHRDNLVLLGDAAHAPLPTSGQGACQAMEDAWHLARCLQEHPDFHTAAFRAFTALRQKKTSAITHAARSFAGSLFSRDAEVCHQRNARSKATDYSALVEGMASAWGQGLPIGA